jgi:hypothetical protein
MRKVLLIAFVATLAALQFAVSPAVAGKYAHSRDGFFIGFGLGLGNAGANLNGLDPDRENSGTGNFRLGWAIANNTTLGLESSSWMKTYGNIDGAGTDLKLTGTVTTFALTYFPQNIGFYLRGGLGVATGTAKLENGVLSISDTETGLGLLGALGYEWRLTQKFALGPQFQYAYLNIGGDGTESVDFVSATLQMTWYW